MQKLLLMHFEMFAVRELTSRVKPQFICKLIIAGTINHSHDKETKSIFDKWFNVSVTESGNKITTIMIKITMS